MEKKDLNYFYRLYSGRRRLTIQEKESIIDSVVEKALPQRSRPFWASMGFRYAAAAALIFAVAVPSVWLYQRGGREDEYAARGGDLKPVFTVTCLSDDESTACRYGDKLAFALQNADEEFYFAAFSRHLSSGTVVWYFPNSDADGGVAVADTAPRGLIGDGIVVGEEHPPGTYEVFGLFSRRPMNREAIRAFFDGEQEGGMEGIFVHVTKVVITQ